MMLGQNLILNYLRVPFITMASIRCYVLAVSYFLPVNVGIATQDSHLVFASPFQVGFSDSLIKRCVNRRWWPDPSHCVAPGSLHLFQWDILSCDVAVYRFLIKRITKLHHNVVYSVGKFRSGNEGPQPFVFLLVAVHFPKHY